MPRASTLACRSLGEGGKLACYLMRPPVNLSRLRYHPDSQLFVYEPKAPQDLDDEALVDPLEFFAPVLIHIPEPKKHLVRFYGVYANPVRATCRAEDNALARTDGEVNEATSSPTSSRRWAELIYRIYEVDPLNCPRCGEGMKILTFIIDPKLRWERGLSFTFGSNRPADAAKPVVPARMTLGATPLNGKVVRRTISQENAASSPRAFRLASAYLSGALKPGTRDYNGPSLSWRGEGPTRRLLVVGDRHDQFRGTGNALIKGRRYSEAGTIEGMGVASGAPRTNVFELESFRRVHHP
jgi:Putative transposase